LRTDACCASAAAWSACAWAILACRWMAALLGAAIAAMYPAPRSSIDWICSESTMSPILAISPFDPSSTSVASFCRSVTISSTVIEPMIERRWPAKIRPVSSDIWSWSDRKRCPALTMDSASLPTLNAITARTFSAMPWWVTHCSATSASCMDSVRYRTLRNTGVTKAPWPITTLNGWPSRPPPRPEISMASSGAGTR
jgi:hypothetical protein